MADYETLHASCTTLIVCVCVCVSGDMSPYCSAHDEWLIMKLCMYVRYHTANNVSNFGGNPVTQLNLKNVLIDPVWSGIAFGDEIGLIAIREVSPPFGEEPCPYCVRTRYFVYFIFQLTKNADSYGIVCTVNRCRWI